MSASMDLGNLVVHLLGDASQYTKMMDTVERKMQTTANNMQAMGTKMSLAITVPLAAIGAVSVKAFGDFDQAMTRSLAIIDGVTPELRSQMEDVATTMSRETVTAADDLAESYFFLASAGMDAEQSMAALGAVNQFAIAGAFDMATATDLATDAQTALGLSSKDAQENLKGLTQVTDVLIKANTLANASAQQFAKSLTTKSAASLRVLNKDMEEGVAVLAAFADQGVKGELAGEKLSIVLRDLQNANIKNNKEWRELGLNVFDANEKMLPLAKIVQQLEGHLGNLSDKQKKATLSLLGFQERSVSALQTLLGTSDKIQEYERQLRDAGGTTDIVAQRQMEGFNSQMKILKNNISAVNREIGEILAPFILQLNGYIKTLTQQWSALNEETKRWIVIAGLAAAAIGPLLLIGAQFIKMSLLLVRSIRFITMAFEGLMIAASGPLLVIGLIIGVAYTFRAIWKKNLYDVQGFWEDLKVVASAFWEKVKEIGSGVNTYLVQPWVNAQKAIHKAMLNTFIGLIGVVGGVWGVMRNFVKWLVTRGAEGSSGGFAGIGETFKEGYKAAQEGVKEAVDVIGTEAKELESKALDVAQEAGKAVAIYGPAIGQAIAETVTEQAKVVKDQFKEDVENIKGVITEQISKLKTDDPSKGLFDGAKESAEAAKNEVVELNKAVLDSSKIGKFLVSNNAIDYEGLRAKTISSGTLKMGVPKLDTLSGGGRSFGPAGGNQTQTLIQQNAERNALLKRIVQKDRGLI